LNEKAYKQYLEYLKLSGIQDIFLPDKPAKKNSDEPLSTKPETTAETIPPKTATQMLNATEVKDADEKLRLLAIKYSSCQKCQLWQERNKFCYGNGSGKAKLMLIGEGPGADEDRTGRVFVGRAGQLLTKMLLAIKLQREEVYIGNIVKCRPPNNRNPLPEEARACLPYLEEQIEIIQPKLLLLLGKVAASELLGSEGTMTQYRSQTYLYKGIKTYVTFHPSALLRNPNWKRDAWIDLQKLQKDYENL